MNEPHEVSVLCNCTDIEYCRFEIYLSDVRIANDEIERYKVTFESLAKLAVERMAIQRALA
jgi:hypothetical protein